MKKVLYILFVITFLSSVAYAQQQKEKKNEKNRLLKLLPDTVPRGEAYNIICQISEIIEVAPSDPILYASRANIYIQVNDFDMGFADYNKALELDPINDLIYCRRGIAYYKKGSYDLAIIDLNSAIKLNQDIPIYYFYRAEINIKLNNTLSAIKDLTKATEKKPDYADAYLKKAILCDAIDYKYDAIECYLKYLMYGDDKTNLKYVEIRLKEIKKTSKHYKHIYKETKRKIRLEQKEKK
jgi:tetratricopeptide (TPR) repeat protein